MNEIDKLKQENAELIEEIKQLHNGRKPIELYSLFGKPISYWEKLETENKVLTDSFNDLLAEVGKDIPFEGLIEYGGLTPLEVLRGIKAQNKKFKQALQEIKEIAEKLFKGISLFKMKEIARDIEKILELTKAEEE